MTSLNPLAQEQIAKLHRECVENRADVIRILKAAATNGGTLTAGVSRKAAVRECGFGAVDEQSMYLSCSDFSPVNGRHYYFTLKWACDEFFFTSRLTSSVGSVLEFDLPRALYRSERREAQRSRPSAFGLEPTASLLMVDMPLALVEDVSRDGLLIGLPDKIARRLSSSFEIEVWSTSGKRRKLFAEVRNRRSADSSSALLGLSVSSVANGSKVELDQAHSSSMRRPGWRQIAFASQAAQVGAGRVWRKIGSPRSKEEPSIVRFENQHGQQLVGIVNTTGTQKGAPVVLIPPAWGKTKETLLPLALSIVETCRREGLPISVLRFDGTNRRGESFIDGEYARPGEEYRRFRFSQAVEDLKAAVRFVQKSKDFQAPRCLIVSFSLSSIEARRVVAMADDEEIAGWIPVVGMVDLQSGLRAVSGGVDYAEGILRGVKFGRHELVGVLADMDFTGRDALDASLVFREDARRDMAKIKVPVTWFHGMHDGWIDMERIRNVLLAGNSSNRRLVQVPTGHQLRTSKEALSTFELIASEAVRMFWGKAVPGRNPKLHVLDRVREAERLRVRKWQTTDLRSFWHNYLFGRNGVLGMDLLTATSAYKEMMKLQIEGLDLNRESCVLDLGSGTGAFLRELKEMKQSPRVVWSLDFVKDALRRSFYPLEGIPTLRAVQADLDSHASLPFADKSFDAVLASLLVSYIREPFTLIKEVRRTMRPGARLVLSSLRRDADISSIYTDGVLELVAADAEREVVVEGIAFAEIQRSFLNEAARILDLEEQGLFQFFDEHELRTLVEQAGLRVLSIRRALGNPPQSIVIVAKRLFDA